MEDVRGIENRDYVKISTLNLVRNPLLQACECERDFVQVIGLGDHLCCSLFPSSYAILSLRCYFRINHAVQCDADLSWILIR